MFWYTSVTPLDAAGVNRTTFRNHAVHQHYITLVKVYYIKLDINVRDVVNSTREEGGGYSKLDIISKYDQQAGL